MINTISESSENNDPNDIKRELLMVKKDIKKLEERVGERDREIEKLKKENFNLINRFNNLSLLLGFF